MRHEAAGPRFIGVGGFLKALIMGLTGSCAQLPKFFLCPLLFFLWLPLTLCCPPAAVWILERGRRKNLISSSAASFSSLEPTAAERSSFGAFKTLLLSAALYLAAAALILGLLQRAEQGVLADAAAAAQTGGQSLQQLLAAMGRQLFFYQLCAAAAGTVLIFVIGALTFAQLHGQTFGTALSSALKALGKNIPGLGCIILLFWVLTLVIENTFAGLKVASLSEPGAFWWQPYYTWAFLALRVYLLQALCVTLLLTAGGVFGLFNLSVQRQAGDSSRQD